MSIHAPLAAASSRVLSGFWSFVRSTPQRFTRLQCTGVGLFIEYTGAAQQEVSLLLLDARRGMANATIVEQRHSLGASGRGRVRCDAEGCSVE